MLLVNVHQLDVIFADSILFTALEYEVDSIGCIFSLQGENVFILCRAEDFGQRIEVDTESNVAVTSKGGEHLCFEHHGDQGDVGVVHCLKGNAGVIAVEVAVLHEIFDGINNLLQT